MHMSTDVASTMLDAQALAAWVGRSEVTRDRVTPVPCAALAATLDRDPTLPADGTPLPPLWHWLYCLPLTRASETGADGHPRRGGFLPPVPLPRRMWAGSRFRFASPLAVGDAIRRTSTIEDVAVKQGRSGPLVFVTVRHEFVRERDAVLAIVEHHDIVYRAAAPAAATSPPAAPAPASARWQRRVTPEPVLLFRYSALTFNGHRIHYDAPYVTGVEGYSGLIVHGPLLATLLLDLVRRERPNAHVTQFSFRALRPVFDIGSFVVCGEPHEDGSVGLWIRDAEGALAMEASAVIDA